MPETQLHKVVDDELRASSSSAATVESLVGAVVIHNRGRDVRGNLSSSAVMTAAHQNEAVYLEVEHNHDDRFLRRRFKPAEETNNSWT